MGKVRSTWPKGQKPPVKRPKGSKNKRTLVKEAIGLQNWEGLQTYIETEGATKLVQEMSKLKGRDFVMAIQAMTEFVKPKLARKEVKADVAANVAFSKRPVIFK